ncbi:hypothetical protein HanIR_Chr16g0802841 [Helianthus annuus]|nr:hypothetical protein HanIR_Chr16g0802841 [Helianthus annuus]
MKRLRKKQTSLRVAMSARRRRQKSLRRAFQKKQTARPKFCHISRTTVNNPRTGYITCPDS